MFVCWQTSQRKTHWDHLILTFLLQNNQNKQQSLQEDRLRVLCFFKHFSKQSENKYVHPLPFGRNFPLVFSWPFSTFSCVPVDRICWGSCIFSWQTCVLPQTSDWYVLRGEYTDVCDYEQERRHNSTLTIAGLEPDTKDPVGVWVSEERGSVFPAGWLCLDVP